MDFFTFASVVIGKTADLYDVQPLEIVTPCRERRVSRPRMAAVWAIRQCEPRTSGQPIYSFAQLCRIFPWTDHTTALHAEREARRLREVDPDYRSKSDELLAFARSFRETWAVANG